jgi:hypothetical protein
MRKKGMNAQAHLSEFWTTFHKMEIQLLSFIEWNGKKTISRYCTFN